MLSYLFLRKQNTVATTAATTRKETTAPTMTHLVTHVPSPSLPRSFMPSPVVVGVLFLRKVTLVAISVSSIKVVTLVDVLASGENVASS